MEFWVQYSDYWGRGELLVSRQPNQKRVIKTCLHSHASWGLGRVNHIEFEVGLLVGLLSKQVNGLRVRLVFRRDPSNHCILEDIVCNGDDGCVLSVRE